MAGEPEMSFWKSLFGGGGAPKSIEPAVVGEES
jgi:hypothetical protein